MPAKKPVKVSKTEAMKDPLRVATVTDKMKDDGAAEVEGQYQYPILPTCPCCGTTFRIKPDEYIRYYVHEEDGCYFRA